jgi:hypothetical protein
MVGVATMALMQVFDRPACCATGASGPNVEPRLAQFAADLEWLMSHGIEVRRFSFAQEPHAFAACELVRSAVAKSGDKCLPLILLDGEVVAQGAYPSREELAVLTSVSISQGASAYSHAVEELVAIGAAIGANSASQLEDHFRAARAAGVSRDDLVLAIATARSVNEAASSEILKLAGRLLAAAADEEKLQPGPCCTTTRDSASGRCC